MIHSVPQRHLPGMRGAETWRGAWYGPLSRPQKAALAGTPVLMAQVWAGPRVLFSKELFSELSVWEIPGA